MAVNAATPADTYIHVFGSGLGTYEWWLRFTDSVTDYDNVPDDWTVDVMADDGDGGVRRVRVDHKLIMKTARYVLAHKGEKRRTTRGTEYPAWSTCLEEEAHNLIFDVDEADLDALCADELLQLAVLGEVIYG